MGLVEAVERPGENCRRSLGTIAREMYSHEVRTRINAWEAGCGGGRETRPAVIAGITQYKHGCKTVAPRSLQGGSDESFADAASLPLGKNGHRCKSQRSSR